MPALRAYESPRRAQPARSVGGRPTAVVTGGRPAPRPRARPVVRDRLAATLQRVVRERNTRAAPAPGAGAPVALPPAIQGRMEAALGADLSGVRVHPESGAAQTLGAVAFTRGDDIHVAPGFFDQHTARGRHILGHELAHVVQQRAGRVRATTTVGAVAVNDDRSLEAEAHVDGLRAAASAAAPAPCARPQQRAGEPLDDVIQRITYAELISAGTLWNARVWIAADYQDRDVLINNINVWIGHTGFRVGRGFQPYDPVVWPARKYTAIAADLDQAAAANAVNFQAFLAGTQPLENLSRQLQELALIACFAEVGRGYATALQTLPQWVRQIAAGNKSWSDVKLEFHPSLTYAEDAGREWTRA